MANMSYCRFHNTSVDVADCLDAIDEGTIASPQEVTNAKNMFKSVLDYCKQHGIVDQYDEEGIYRLMESAINKEDE